MNRAKTNCGKREGIAGKGKRSLPVYPTVIVGGGTRYFQPHDTSEPDPIPLFSARRLLNNSSPCLLILPSKPIPYEPAKAQTAKTMADLVVGVIPVAAKVLQGCLDTYRLFSEAKELGSESQSLIWKFRIQQTRLQIWGEEWGLLASSTQHAARTETDDDENNPLVLETLLRISDTLRDYKQLNKRYGLSLVSDDPKYRRPVGGCINSDESRHLTNASGLLATSGSAQYSRGSDRIRV